MVDAKKLITLLLSGLLIIVLAACDKAPDAPVNHRRGFKDDVPIDTHAADAIKAFQLDYPGMAITKLRWYKELDDTEIYIVEGIQKQDKNIVKYHMEANIIIDRIERTLRDSEMENGKSVETPLDYDALLTYTELCDIATNELDGTVMQFTVKWKGEAPTAYIEVQKEGYPRGFTINASTGEILF